MKYILDNLEGLYIGDVCYALEDDAYYNEWGIKHNFQDGLITTESNLRFAVSGTAYGDGLYKGSDGSEFPVDAGVIGVVDLRLAKRYTQAQLSSLGLIIPNATKVEFSAEDGYFEIIVFENDKEILSFNIDTTDEYY